MNAHEWAWTRLVEHARDLGRDPDLAGVGDEELVEQVRTGASRIAAMTCVWLTQVAELVVRGTWGEDGARTPGEWLSWACGVELGTAREYVRVGLALRRLSGVRARFVTGTLSYSKVRAITRVATAETEGALVALADRAPAAQLERILSISRRQALREDADVDDGSRGGEVRDVRRVLVDADTVEFRVRMGPDDAAAFEERLDRLVDLADQADQADRDDGAGGAGGVEDRPGVDARGVRRAAALADAVVTAVGLERPDRSGVDDHLVVLHVDVDALGVSAETSGRDAGVRRVVTGRGRQVSMRHATLRRLVCDAEVAVVPRGDDAHPGDIGRRSRSVPARLRRALQVRDRGCRFPGCGRTRRLHAHHVVHWADGGETTLGNLVLLCGGHHRFVHERGWQLRAAGPGRWTFHRPGSDVAHPNALTLPHVSAETSPGGVAPDPRALQPPWWNGDPWDLAETVSMVADYLTGLTPPPDADPDRYPGLVAA